ncbi:hypothetical protein SBA3_1820044 [Candidatus Sulfopaludibacter sp. SbA3]|nr:hypothetical protein SBA3_1820044 [Candidatus Sulfopaludibacter sp. SbA3]
MHCRRETSRISTRSAITWGLTASEMGWLLERNMIASHIGSYVGENAVPDFPPEVAVRHLDAGRLGNGIWMLEGWDQPPKTWLGQLLQRWWALSWIDPVSPLKSPFCSRRERVVSYTGVFQIKTWSSCLLAERLPTPARRRRRARLATVQYSSPLPGTLRNIVSGVFTPVLAKHSKSLNLLDSISVGVDRMQRNFGPMQKQVEAWRETELSNVAAKTVTGLPFIKS